MYGTVSVLLYILRFAIWPKMWSTLEIVVWGIEKNVYMHIVAQNTEDVY